MLKTYRDKDGYTFQYEEGTQPEDYELVEPKTEPEVKEVKPQNKARRTRTKKAAE